VVPVVNADVIRLVDNLLWVLAAACIMALAMWLLYLALGLYGLALTKLIQHLGATAAFIEFCQQKRNRNTRWNRLVNWSVERWRGDSAD
jgi:hypothetical protein